ncbi:hypothetical protein BOTBODRAFT_30557 [Botryobasidium botryosum FD-172 SS1]|uniref:Altered inheritance of mitochondria protein 24, mitochondrial n=1 Tax=Botryobasidium botryosum (strain FD-172 SS1) TaxID=930990 RepID=A0A067MXL1_BOTB1|nr:hypothetical protein BOTBODRAFT_30557 [Botryobasidium botryosum FD-172 SS1]
MSLNEKFGQPFPEPQAGHAQYAPAMGFPQGPGPSMPTPGPGFEHGQSPDGSSSTIATVGSFDGIKYRIDHRDSNSILTLTLTPGVGNEVRAKPGAMVAMDPRVSIEGKFKFSLSSFLSSSEVNFSHFKGAGDVLLAPEIWGDIVPITIYPNTSPTANGWNMSKASFLACTNGVKISPKIQNASKGFFSGEGFFVSQVDGHGVLFAQGLGAIIRHEVDAGKDWIVDNGHLVAWNCPYEVKPIQAAGGFFSRLGTEEGMVCRFTGPGTIYLQTRNPETLRAWMTASRSK